MDCTEGIGKSWIKARLPIEGSQASPRTQGIALNGMFTPVLAKHPKSFSLIDGISVGVDRTQQNFELM